MPRDTPDPYEPEEEATDPDESEKPEADDHDPEPDDDDPDDKPEPAKGEDKPKPKGRRGEPEEVRLSKRDYDQLQRSLREEREAAQYWAEQARGTPKGGHTGDETEGGGGEPGIPDDDTPDPLDSDPGKFVDEFTTKGARYLIAQGFLTKKAAREIFAKIAREEAGKAVNGAEKRLSRDATLLHQYPDLAKQDSDMYKRTAEVVGEMIADDPDLKSSPALLRAAAKVASAQLRAEGRGREHSAEEVEERYRRQAGDRDRRPSHSDDDYQVSPTQLQMLKGLRVTKDAFLKQRKALAGRR